MYAIYNLPLMLLLTKYSPLMNSKKYQIDIVGQLIIVKLNGHWSLSADKQYLADLETSIGRVNSKPWGILVNMQGWQLKSSQVNMLQQNVANKHLDRSNQLCECWLVDNFMQASEIEPFVASVPGLRFRKTTSKSDAVEWLSLFSLTTDLQQAQFY